MATPILMPKLGLTMTSGTVMSWDKHEGDSVKAGEVVSTISSEKLTSDIEAPVSGTLIKITVPEEGEAEVKTPIGYIGDSQETISEQPQQETSEQTPDLNSIQTTPTNSDTKSLSTKQHKIFITPLARKIAAEHDIDYHQITGTGGNGRITKRDVENYQPIVKTSSKKTPVGSGLTGMRKVIAQHMYSSLHNTAQLTLNRHVNISKLMNFRQEIKQETADTLNKGQLSLTTLLARATILALQDTPQMNGRYEDGVYTQSSDINLGLAVALEEGLIVPVVKKSQNLTLTKLAQALTYLSNRSRNGHLKYEESQEGTFTITNLGHENIDYFTPIINSPEIGILGIGSLQQQLKLASDQKVISEPYLPLSLTFDHQIIDGRQAAIFLDDIANYLQSPYQLIF